MNVNEEIRQKIADVAANKLSVWAFEQWLEPLSWSMHRDLPIEDRRFIGLIQSIFARFDYEGADEAALSLELIGLVRPRSRAHTIKYEIALKIDLKNDAVEFFQFPVITKSARAERFDPQPVLC